MLTVCGRKNLSYRIRILAIYPIAGTYRLLFVLSGRKTKAAMMSGSRIFLPELECASLQRLVPFAELFERHGAFLRIQLIFDSY